MAYRGINSEKFEDLGEELDVLCSEIQSGIEKIQRLDGDNEESLQLLCCQYAEKREGELNNVEGRKRKRKKSAKLREQYDDFGTEEEHREEVMPVMEKKSKTKKKDGLDRSKIMAKTKGKKEATDKVIQLESAKIMAQQVIAAMQSTAVSEKSPGEENSVILVRDEQPLSISTPNPISRESTLTNNDKDVTSSNPSPLPSPKLTSTKTYDSRTRENESLSKTSHRNSCSTPYSPSNLMANSHTYITLTTPQPRQRDLIPDHDPTPIKSTTPVNRVASARQLHFQPDITNSTEELSSEINNAICLSYNCNQWQAEPDDAEFEVSAPKCQQCEELREENSRLKAIIEKLQLEKESSTKLKKQKIREVQKQIEDSKIILEEMEEEAVIAPGAYRNKMNATVRNKSRELEKMKRDLNKITSGFQASSARDDLLSTGPKEFDPNASQRNKLIQGTEIMNRTSDSIARSQQVAAESEQIGVEIIDELDTQRDSLIRTQDRLHDTDEDLIQSRKILTRMAFRVATNKLIMGIIILVELVIIGAVVYVRFIR